MCYISAKQMAFTYEAASGRYHWAIPYFTYFGEHSCWKPESSRVREDDLNSNEAEYGTVESVKIVKDRKEQRVLPSPAFRRQAADRRVAEGRQTKRLNTENKNFCYLDKKLYARNMPLKVGGGAENVYSIDCLSRFGSVSS